MPTLHWIGKDKVVNHHTEVPFRVLEHKYGYRGNNPADTSETHSGNKIIHGDNLEALKALLPEYEGKINCVYIDPPYNTGKEGWIYNDNVNDPHIRKWLGEVVGAEGEDLSRHDKWLCMMYPRLVLLRDLLAPNGAIFISIDDNEYSRLKNICDEIFGSNGFVANIQWQRTYSPRNDKDGIAVEAEHILVYGKKPGWIPQKLKRTEEMDSKYGNPDNDFNSWRSDNAYASGAADHQGMVYAIQHPFTGELKYPIANNHWRYGQDEMLKIMNGWCEYELRDLNDEVQRATVCGILPKDVKKGVKGIVLKEDLETSRVKAQEVYNRGQWPKYYFTKGGFGEFTRKTYLNAVEGRLVTNFWPYKEVGHTDGAKKELKDIFGGKVPFDTPKPLSLIQRVLDIALKEDGIILDSFAGSGTTAHAVLKNNLLKRTNHKFILIELMDYAESITATRVKKAITGYNSKKKQIVELYSKNLTKSSINRVPQYLNEAEQIIKAQNAEFNNSCELIIEDNKIKVIASMKVKDEVQGTGGSFDYYEIGEPLFLPDGNLNETVGVEKMREYIFYTETREHLTRKRDSNNPYLLDYHEGTGYFFYYELDEITTLSHDTLNIVPQRADHYVIYADVCAISKEQLAQMNITFKKIPRDINRF